MKRYFTVASAVVIGLMMTSASFADITDNSGAGFNIPDNDPAGIFSTINIAADETITDVTVTLFGLSHTWVGDVTAEVTHDGTSTAVLFERVGDTGGTSGDSSAFGGDYTFADGGADLWAAADAAGFGEVIAAGTYAASGLANAPVSLSASFSGESTQGNWTLFMNDVAQGDTGSITGWGISFSSSSAIPEPGSFALLGALGLGCVIRRRR